MSRIRTITTPTGPEGLTLAELTEFVAQANAADGAHPDDLVKVRVDFKAGIRKIWTHPAGTRYRLIRDGQ